ncbi:GNAT family N-acetyltransferase, partial [Thioalkalicoccus limnaeus]
PSILVTAPTRRAAETLFRHARARLPEVRTSGSQIRYQRRTLAFVAPEDLDPASHPAALLLVDEAAAIPVPLLERALTGYPRVVFATTVHGYEGTGRGFEVRFRATLDRSTPNWRALTLTAPIRWAERDPLESLAARALLLDAEPASSDTVADAEVANCRWECLDRQRLLEDETSLRELFGLLILAHYQTRPFDLRHLLDGPNVRVYVLRHREAIVATLLTADEGAFDEALSRAIFAGERRPRGHLLPQTLAAHAGLISAPRWRYRRVLRLAVHPAVQRRGLGALALRRLIDDTRADEADLIGASFGATPELLGFWTRCGFAPVHVGTRRNAASGEHALVVLKPVTPAGKALVAEGRQRLARRLPQWLAGPLRMAPARLIARLLAELPDRRPHLDPAEWIELAGFAYEYRSLEASLPVLAELVGARLGEQIRIGRVDLASAEALIATVLQMHEPSTAAARLGLPGRAALLTRLRAAISAIMRP